MEAVRDIAAATPDQTDRLIAALEPVTSRYQDSAARREQLALVRALRLSSSLDVCEALLRGERVPLSRLEPEWAKAYGLL